MESFLTKKIILDLFWLPGLLPDPAPNGAYVGSMRAAVLPHLVLTPERARILPVASCDMVDIQLCKTENWR